MKWPDVPIKDVCLLAVDCVNKTAPVVEYETPYRMLRTTNVRGGFVDADNTRFVTEETFVKWTRRGVPQKGDVILTREAPLGDVGRLTSDNTVFLGQRLFMYRADPEKLNSKYLAYIMQSPLVQGRIKSKGFGATVEHARVGDCENLLIPVPGLRVQERIGETLSAYDDLTENNKRRIELLEESARQLYKEWFVRFGFPGHEHVKIIDGMPEGWNYRSLIEIAELTMGQSPKSEFYNSDGEGLPFHQGVTNFGFRFVKHETYCTQPTRLSKAGDILFSVRAPVGRINITNDVIVLGRGLAAIRSIDGYQSFLLYALKSYFFKEDMIGGGAIYAAVTKKDMESQELLIPTNNLLQEFEELASDIDKQIYQLDQMNVYLTKARDILLPKLMSGEIAV